MNHKQEILQSLKHTYCRLMPSGIEGVGVFAICDIPANTPVFEGQLDRNWHTFFKEDLIDLDKEVKKMIDDFFVIEKDGSVRIPEGGLTQMDISYYINHSKNPNVYTTDTGHTFVSKRDIKKGEEITVDYGTYDEKFI